MLKSVIFFCIVLLFTSFTLTGQEWGEITEEEWLLTSIEEDPDADAVVLFDLGKIYITPDFGTVVKRHKRFKILTEKGKDRANYEIYYYFENDIDDIEAITYLPNGDEIELDDDNIFEEEIEKTKKKVFAIPGVEVGAIIEIQYELYSEYVTYLEPWYFQGEDYTKLSEVVVHIPKGFNFNAFNFNLVYYDLEKFDEDDWDPYKSGKKLRKYTWRIKDLPAIREEPYMFNENDYLARLDFQLASFVNAYNNITYIKTWDDMAERVRKYYDPRISDDDGIEELNSSLLAGIVDQNVKIKTIYQYLCRSIENESKGGFLNEELLSAEQVLEQKKGNRNEKNLLLISMLKQAGFDARPLLISTRSHGEFSSNIVKLRQFNHVIAYVKLGKEAIYLDTHDKFCPMEMLPSNCSVGQGLLINEDNGKIISVKSPKIRNRKDIETTVQLMEDGSFEVESLIKNEGYIANSVRRSIDKNGAKDYFKDLVDDLYENAVLDTFYVTNLDSIDNPLELKVLFKMPDYIQQTGNLVYFQPPLHTKLTDNPFKNEKRSFPVDYSYTIMISERVKIQLPQNYKVSELPRRTKSRINKFSYSTFYFNSDNKIEVNRTYNRTKTRFLPNEYRQLREQYDKVIESDNSQIILEKI